MKLINTKYPIDSIILTEEQIITGSYNFENGIRNGEITFYDKTSDKETFLESKIFKTSGTFNIKKYDNLIISANSTDISLISDKKEEKIKSSLNTDIEYHGNIFSSTDKGSIQIFDFNSVLKEINVSDQILWCIKNDNQRCYTGGDDKYLYSLDLRNDLVSKIYKKEGVITCIEIVDNYLYVGGYDGIVDVIDIRTHLFVDKIKTDPLWGIKNRENYFVTACMYEGIKIYDKDWNVVKVYKTDSICYDGDLKDDTIVFSSFYDKKLFIDGVAKKENILNTYNSSFTE